MRTSPHTRRGLCAVLIGVAFLVAATSVEARNVTMNVGWSVAAQSNPGILAGRFKELAEKYSGGTISVKLRCCAQIGTEDEAFKSLQLGTVDSYIITTNNVSPHFPLMDIFVLPYIFEGPAHAVRVLDGPIGKEIRAKLLRDTRVHLLAYGAVEYRDVYNTERPITRIQDFSGLRIRVPQNTIMIDTYKAFGANPTPLAWSEMTSALQTGTVDGGDNGTSVIRSQKFYEMAKYLTILEHFVSLTPLFASDRFMSKLDERQRAAVERAAEEAAQYQRTVVEGETQAIRDFLVSKGMERTEPNKKPFIEAALRVQDGMAREKGKDFQALLREIRAAAR